MSEQWSKKSVIDEKQSAIITVQLPELKVKISITDIYDIIKTYQDKGKIDENAYRTLIFVITNEMYIKNCSELCNYIKELFGEKLKEEFFKYTFKKYKDMLSDYAYKFIYDYFINGINKEITIADKNELYNVLVDLPMLFNNSMVPIKYREKLNKILTPDEIREKDLKRIRDVKNDTRASDILYQKKLTNENLKNKILQDIPAEYSVLEKSIYIYIKLCQYLSYDPNYYANKRVYRQIHQSFDNTPKIGQDTNNAVCYEFITIYSEMLKDLGIEISVDTKLDMDVDENDNIIYTNFSDEHSKMQYIVDDLLIFADSTTSVLAGDLINAKMNKPLNGIRCLNVDQKAKQKFNNALQKVYQNLQYNNSNFKKYNDEIKKKPLVERLKILFDNICDADFNPTDFISYITSIKHELFTDGELEWNLQITYIGRNFDGNQYPIGLFSVNTNDIKNVQMDTTQYLYDPSQKSLIKVDKETIEEIFKKGELFFIDGVIKIPNINLYQTKK